ncbi:hypothetical protein ACTFIZ_005143 [Dictyostelium cf. discoideum]
MEESSYDNFNINKFNINLNSVGDDNNNNNIINNNNNNNNIIYSINDINNENKVETKSGGFLEHIKITDQDNALGEENYDLEINYEVVLVFDRSKNVVSDDPKLTWDIIIKKTMKILKELNLYSVLKVGTLDENHIFIIVGTTDEVLRQYCIDNYIQIQKKIVTETTRISESMRLHLVETILINSNDLKYIYDDDFVIDKYPYANKNFDQLKRECQKKWFFQSLDINVIKDYFGEEVTFYFLFLRFYNVGLGIVSLFGLAVAIVSYTRDSYKFASSSFSIALAVLSTLFFEIWKRYGSIYSWKWDQEDFIDDEEQLPSFKPGNVSEGVYHKGIFLKSKHFGKKVKYVQKNITSRPYLTSYQQKMKLLKTIGTFSVVVTLVLIVPIFTISIFTLRIALESIENKTVESGIGSVINALFILFFNFIYKNIAYYLTKFESHRVASTFNASYSTKLFLFQFVNSFSGLFYIAFLKNNVYLWGDIDLEDQCSTPNKIDGLWKGCTEDLQFQLFSILAVNFIASIFSELLGPWIQYYIKIIRQKPTGFREKIEPFEQQFYRDTFDTFQEFNQIIIQFSYISMFSAASPISPIISFFHNIFEERVDSYKLINSLRRPNYNGSNGLGSWFFIIVLVGMFSVLTNVLLIGFSFPTLLYFTDSPYYVLWIVFILEHLVILTKVVLAKAIPDETKKLKKKKACLDYITKSIMENDREFSKLLIEKIKSNEITLTNDINPDSNHNNIVPTPFTSKTRQRAISISSKISKTMHSVINIKHDVDYEDDNK